MPNVVKFPIFVSVVLPVVLYECETQSVTLREEYRWWVFESRVLRRIHGPNMKKKVVVEEN